MVWEECEWKVLRLEMMSGRDSSAKFPKSKVVDLIQDMRWKKNNEQDTELRFAVRKQPTNGLELRFCSARPAASPCRGSLITPGLVGGFLHRSVHGLELSILHMPSSITGPSSIPLTTAAPNLTRSSRLFWWHAVTELQYLLICLFSASSSLFFVVLF